VHYIISRIIQFSHGFDWLSRSVGSGCVSGFWTFGFLSVLVIVLGLKGVFPKYQVTSSVISVVVFQFQFQLYMYVLRNIIFDSQISQS